MKSYVFFVLAMLSIIQSMDLSPEIINTLNADHERMKNFKVNYNRMSCKLLITAKLKAMFELEEIDVFTNQVVPEKRVEFLDELRETMLNKCLATYRDDKILFEHTMFYSFPNPDYENYEYYNIDVSKILDKYPKYTATPEKIAAFEKRKKRREEKLKADQEAHAKAQAESEGKPELENKKEEKVDL